MTPAPVVAVFNTSEDTTDMLRFVLEHAGFTVVTVLTSQLRDGHADLEHLMRQYRPSVVIYDIALPYEANWRLFEHVRDSPACQGVKFVMTTTNVGRVREVVGQDPHLLELVGKPYDLGLLVQRVRDVLDNRERSGDVTH